MVNVDKKIVITATILAAVTIAIGAFGAHGLKRFAEAEAVASFETGVRYQMYHALALLVIGWIGKLPQTIKKWVFRLFLFGILLFSGSIYLLVLDDALSFDASPFGFLTPIGGLLFIIGWVLLAIGVWKQN